MIHDVSNHRAEPGAVAPSQDVADTVAGLIEMESPGSKVLLLLLVGPGIVPDGVADALFPPRRRRLLFVSSTEDQLPRGRMRRRSTPWRFRANSASMPFADECVDLAVALFRRDRLAEARPALDELHRILRPRHGLIAAVLGCDTVPVAASAAGVPAPGSTAIAWCRTLEEHGLEVDVTVTTRSDAPDPSAEALTRARPVPGVRRWGPAARYAELPHSWSSLVIGAHLARINPLTSFPHKA